MDKKIFQKLTKYEEDKRFLQRLYLEDMESKGGDQKLKFQSDESR